MNRGAGARMSDFGIEAGLVPSANAVAEFLALDDFDRDRDSARFDLVILAGNAIMATAASAFEYARATSTRLLITGGIGHSTALLAEAVAGHPRYRHVAVEGRPEAEILRDIAIKEHGLDDGQILVEPASTNCGENAAFSRRLLEELGMRPGAALMVQDPLMQRRTDASFRQAWSESSWRTDFVSWPTFVPRLEDADGEVRYAAGMPSPLWTGERFMALLLGEIPRLRDDENGYGPRGKGFIAHVDIPDAVEAHYHALAAYFGQGAPALSRRIAPR